MDEQKIIIISIVIICSCCSLSGAYLYFTTSSESGNFISGVNEADLNACMFIWYAQARAVRTLETNINKMLDTIPQRALAKQISEKYYNFLLNIVKRGVPLQQLPKNQMEFNALMLNIHLFVSIHPEYMEIVSSLILPLEPQMIMEFGRLGKRFSSMLIIKMIKD